MNTKTNLIGFITEKGAYETIPDQSFHFPPLSIPNCQHPEEGFFGTESIHWKVFREPSIIVAGISALLLQIAHPAVAQGVAKYSGYQKDFWGRAHRTVFSMTKIWFGSQKEAIQSAQRLYHIHQHIQGIYTKRVNGETQMIPYCAAEPHLLLWVLLTIYKAAVDGYEKTLHPLSKEDKKQFYEESKITAQLMGIPLSEYPKSWDKLMQSYDDILADDVLEVGELANQITKDLFAAYFPFSGIMHLFAAGFIPAQLAKDYGLKQKLSTFNLLIHIILWINKLLPNSLRYAPHYYQAMYRITKGREASPSFLARWFHLLGKHVRMPFLYERLNFKNK